jgi:hypothetical protein
MLHAESQTDHSASAVQIQTAVFLLERFRDGHGNGACERALAWPARVYVRPYARRSGYCRRRNTAVVSLLIVGTRALLCLTIDFAFNKGVPVLPALLQPDTLQIATIVCVLCRFQ